MDMQTHVQQNLAALGVKPGDRVGAAVSGGVDSMVLLHLLCNLRREMNILIIAYHMEHGIRGENSVGDMDFVTDACARLGVPCIIERADIPAIADMTGASVETAARNARYAFLDRQDADYIATAHHMDDLAETVIMNLVRGSGLAGLCGIPEARGRYIRPLLGVSRAQIEQYARRCGITYVSDATNADTAYTRNYIRREIMPRLTRINPEASAHIAATAGLLREDEAALMKAAKNADCIEPAEDGVYIDIGKLRAQAPAVQKRIVRMAIAQKYDIKDVESVHIGHVLALAEKGITAKRADIKHGIFAAVVYDKLMIGKYKEKKYNNALMSIMTAGTYRFEDTVFESKSFFEKPLFAAGEEYFDSDAIKGAQLRHRREGDCISPLGMAGTRRLCDYLSDRKVPLHQRDALILLARGSEVFWVVGVGVSAKSRVTPGSRVLRIKYWEK